MRLGLSGRKQRLWIIPVIAAVLCAAMIFAGGRFRAAYCAAAHAYANNAATAAISESVYKVFQENGGDYTTSVSGDRATVLTTDTTRINRLNAKLSESIQSDILAQDYKTVYIPLGSIAGIAAFSGIGTKIPVKIHPVSLVNTDFDEQFESCGINQARHTISLNVEIIMVYSGYLFSEKETVRVSVPILDSVIVGDTPEYYGGGEFFAGNEVKNE